MANDVRRITGWLRNAMRAAKNSGKPLSQVLDDINAAIHSNGLQNGQVVIGTSEAGGTVTFAIPEGHAPFSFVELNEDAIRYCAECADPENPVLVTRQNMRLRVSFAKAVPC